MKHAYSLFALAALLAAAPAAQAQQAWQPFRAGTIYQYSETATPGDTTHTLQVGLGAAVAGSPDTVYRFNRRLPRLLGNSFAVGGLGIASLRADNLFGATLRVRPGAVFVLTAANGRTLTLRPRAPLGQNWAAGPAGLMAHVMSRGVAQVLGQPDSVALIMLSDGQDVRLSKRFGLLDGPSLDSYLNGRNRRRALTLTGRSGSTVAPLLVGPAAAFNFQPGDLFQRLYVSYNGMGGGVCSEIWTQDSILTRALNRTADSVIYTVRVRRATRSYGQAGAPFGLCSSAGISYAANTNRLAVPLAVALSWAVLLTNSFTPYASASQTYPFGLASGPAVRSNRYYRRPVWEQQDGNIVGNPNADSAMVRGTIDNSRVNQCGVGLGVTRNYSSSMGSYNDEQLVAYRKGSETWGTFFRFPQLLAARAVRPAASTAAFPQPFGASLAVKVDLARPQSVALALHDALGRTVLLRPAVALAAGNQQQILDTQNLPAGLYTLHIGLLGEGRTEVLKVVKEE